MVLSVSGAPVTMNGVGTGYSLVNVFDTITADTMADLPEDGVDAVLSPDYSLTLSAAGRYRIEFWASFSGSAGGALVTFRPHLNGSPGLVEVDRDIAAGDTGSVSFSGIITYAAGDEIDVRVKVDTGTNNLTFLAAGLNIHRIS